MTADALSTTFSALADPTRRAILARLAEGEVRVTDLARPFPMSLNAVSKHIGVLERGGWCAAGGRAASTSCPSGRTAWTRPPAGSRPSAASGPGAWAASTTP